MLFWHIQASAPKIWINVNEKEKEWQKKIKTHEIKLNAITKKKLEKRKQWEKLIPTGTEAN